jgi:hypothetical protein
MTLKKTAPPITTSDDWKEWRQLIFAELERHDKEIEHLIHLMREIQVSQAKTLVKVSALTAISAAFSSALITVLLTVVFKEFFPV